MTSTITKLTKDSFVLIVWMEDDLVHTDEHPFCDDLTCPCQEDRSVKRVSLSRINAIADTSKAVFDTDCSIQVFSPRLSATGALDNLLVWLRTHEHELQAAKQTNEDCPEDVA